MKTITRRLARLEDQFGTADGKPRRHLRMVVCLAGTKPNLEDSPCRRTFCSDGTLIEIFDFTSTNKGPDEART